MTLPNNSSMTAAQGNLPAANPGTALGKAQKAFYEEISNSLASVELKLDNEQTSCIYSALSAMVARCREKKLTLNEIDKSNIKEILERVALLRINLTAVPAQGYLIIRGPGKDAPPGSLSTFEFNIMSDGHDALARKFGVGIKKIYPFWAVREGDGFTYPAFTGIEVSPPTWSPKGYTGKVIRVVYPVEYEDGSVVYHIAERDGVITNLQAHILNNIRWEKNQQTVEQVRNAINDRPVEAILDDPALAKWISPAWREPHSREAMIQRKMRINALRPIQLDFGSAYAQEAYNETVMEYKRREDPSPEDVLDADFETKAGKEPPQLSAASSMLTASQAVGKPQPEEIPTAQQVTQETAKKRPF